MENKKLYSQIGARRLDAKVKHFDSFGVSVDKGSLEEIEQTLYQTIFSPMESLAHIPVSSEYNPAATSISYEVATRTGVAKTIARAGDDRPEADVFVRKYSAVVHEGGAAYSYDTDNGDVAAMTGFDIANEKAKAAAMMIAEWHDAVALDGHDTGLTGFANDANVTVAQSAQTWTLASTTGAEMFADVATLLNDITEDSSGAHKATNIALPIACWNRLAITSFDTTSGKTVLEKLRLTYPGVEFSQWSALATQDAAQTGPRIIAFEKKPSNFVYRATVMYDEDLPVRGNFKFNVSCRGRSAGVTVRYPLAVKYQDIVLA